MIIHIDHSYIFILIVTHTYTSSYNLSRMKNILHNREIISSLVLGTLLVVAVAGIVALWTKIDIYIPFFQLGGVILRKKLNATISELSYES